MLHVVQDGLTVAAGSLCLFMLPQARSTRGHLISMSGYCGYRRKATVWAVSSYQLYSLLYVVYL